MNVKTPTIDSLYDAYSGMLFGVAMDITQNSHQAELILSNTFQHFFAQPLPNQNNFSLCIALIKLTIRTAKQLYPTKNTSNLRLKGFEYAPLLNQVLCDEYGFENYCVKHELTQAEGAKKMRHEFKLMAVN